MYTISEFAKRIGVSRNTLRLWEEKGKLVPHHKTPGGHRVYTEEQALKYLGTGSDITLHFEDGILDATPLFPLSEKELSQILKATSHLLKQKKGFLNL